MKLDLNTLTEEQYVWLVDILKNQFITEELKHNRPHYRHSLEVTHLNIDFDVYIKGNAK